jgi:hypothetical protein
LTHALTVERHVPAGAVIEQDPRHNDVLVRHLAQIGVGVGLRYHSLRHHQVDLASGDGDLPRSTNLVPVVAVNNGLTPAQDGLAEPLSPYGGLQGIPLGLGQYGSELRKFGVYLKLSQVNPPQTVWILGNSPRGLI